MRCARPSTIAVLPTPGSPISTGLFLVRRESTCMTRRISSSRPITGSSLPARAASVRSRPNFASAWYFDSGSGSVTARSRARSKRLARWRRAWRPPRGAGRRPRRSSRRREREQQVLGRDVLVLARLGVAEGGLEDAVQRGGERRLRAAVHLGQAPRGAARAAPGAASSGDPELLEDRDRAALGLREQRPQQVGRRDLAVAAPRGEALGLGEGLLALEGELVEAHGAERWARRRREQATRRTRAAQPTPSGASAAR